MTYNELTTKREKNIFHQKQRSQARKKCEYMKGGNELPDGSTGALQYKAGMENTG